MDEQRHAKPDWFVDIERDLRKHIDTKADYVILQRVEKIQNSILTYGIAVICAGAVSILGLYVMYYSGLADLKTQVQVMDNKLTTVKDDVTNIKKTLSDAQITR